MTNEDLGKLSTHELDLVVARCLADHLELPESVRQELEERNVCHHEGKAGVSPLLSRRVVRLLRGELRNDPVTHGIFPPAHIEYVEVHFFNKGVEAAARWLLALSADASLPWEDES